MLIDLDAAKLPRSEAERLKPIIERGWIVIHQHMAAQPRDLLGLQTLMSMLVLERRTRNRDFIIHRLYRAFSKLRMELEEANLYGS